MLKNSRDGPELFILKYISYTNVKRKPKYNKNQIEFGVNKIRTIHPNTRSLSSYLN